MNENPTPFTPEELTQQFMAFRQFLNRYQENLNQLLIQGQGLHEHLHLDSQTRVTDVEAHLRTTLLGAMTLALYTFSGVVEMARESGATIDRLLLESIPQPDKETRVQ